MQPKKETPPKTETPAKTPTPPWTFSVAGIHKKQWDVVNRKHAKEVYRRRRTFIHELQRVPALINGAVESDKHSVTLNLGSLVSNSSFLLRVDDAVWARGELLKRIPPEFAERDYKDIDAAPKRATWELIMFCGNITGLEIRWPKRTAARAAVAPWELTGETEDAWYDRMDREEKHLA